MAYDKKLLAAARRELERERTAHTEELEARRRDIYTREPRIRAIDRELSTTAASVLRAAMESGGDPTAARPQSRSARGTRRPAPAAGTSRRLSDRQAAVLKMRRHRLCRQCDLRVRQGALC